MTLPLLISVPHAGLRIPPEVAPYCVLSTRHILEDSDEGAEEIYDFDLEIKENVRTDIARTIVDVNRSENDRSKDGVIKTHTCWDIPVYNRQLPEEVTSRLLEKYYYPYHDQLRRRAKSAILGLDCHTMAPVGPPVGPDHGKERPSVCLSNATASCPERLFRKLARCLEQSFELRISLNEPFKGGYIIRAHATEIPWVQIELSRTPFMSNSEKRLRLLQAAETFCEMVL